MERDIHRDEPSSPDDATSSFWSIVRETDWSRLSHAYGRASDTPRHLAALAGSDAAAHAQALDHLWSAILHQGSLYPATPPVARAVASLLAHLGTRDPLEHRTDPDAWPPPLRGSLLDFLASFADSSLANLDEPLDEVANPPGRESEIARYEAGEWDMETDVVGSADVVVAEALFARWILAAREICPRLVDAVVPLLTDPLPAVRIRAANCLAWLRRHPEVEPRRAELARLIEQAARAAATQERAALVISLGDLDVDTSPFLADPDQAVRCCAALAPSQRANPAATREILAALKDPAAADHWLPRYAPQVWGWLRFTLVHEAIQRARSFEELLPAALAIASGPASAMTVERDWGRLLAAAFPTPPVGALSPAQRTYLAALVANERLWDPRHGNAHLWFKQLGLTYDRDAYRALLQRHA